MKKDILQDWGSRRKIDFLTPDSFEKKIIIVSTTLNRVAGETVIAQVKSMNYFTAKIPPEGKAWKQVKIHDSPEEAAKFHEKYVKKLRVKDAEDCNIL